MSKRKTNLGDALAVAAPGDAPAKRPDRVGKKGFVIHLDPALLREVKVVAVREDKTLQQVGVEALEALVKSRAKAG